MTHARLALTLSASALALWAGGCRSRTIEITSEPPGALVWLNDEQVGRTPLDVDFVHYGVYDVRLQLEGHQPLATAKAAAAPLIDQPGVDFFTQPFPGRSITRWHFVLEPLPELADQRGAEAALTQRARAVKQAAAQPSGTAGTPATVTPSGTSPSTTAPAPTTAP